MLSVIWTKNLNGDDHALGDDLDDLVDDGVDNDHDADEEGHSLFGLLMGIPHMHTHPGNVCMPATHFDIHTKTCCTRLHGTPSNVATQGFNYPPVDVHATTRCTTC